METTMVKQDNNAAAVMARFFSKVEKKEGGCWEWTGAKTSMGYGQMQTGKISECGNRIPSYAHRLSYEWAKGPIPKDLTLDHLCRNPSCVNPEHLEAVPHRINMIRGFGVAGIHARATTCQRGHPKSAVRVSANGKRECSICRREVWNPARYKRSVEDGNE